MCYWVSYVFMFPCCCTHFEVGFRIFVQVQTRKNYHSFHWCKHTSRPASSVAFYRSNSFCLFSRSTLRAYVTSSLYSYSSVTHELTTVLLQNRCCFLINYIGISTIQLSNLSRSALIIPRCTPSTGRGLGSDWRGWKLEDHWTWQKVTWHRILQRRLHQEGSTRLVIGLVTWHRILQRRLHQEGGTQWVLVQRHHVEKFCCFAYWIQPSFNRPKWIMIHYSFGSTRTGQESKTQSCAGAVKIQAISTLRMLEWRREE